MSKEKRVWATSEEGKIEYVSLTPDRLDETVQLLRNYFFTRETVCEAVGLSKIPEAIAECNEVVIDTAKHGVSVVAIDKESGKVIGALMNKIQDKNTSSKQLYEEFIKKAKHPESKEIFNYLITMEDGADPFTPYNADCMMELVFLCVSPDYAQKGIGYMLCKVSLDLANLLSKGENVKTPLDNTPLPLEPKPQIVTVLWTTFKSQRIGRKLNFNHLKTVSYEDLYYNGKSYASNLGNETKFCIFECKKLQ
ncbi:unnamed protein product [Ceutorhynchus assimilis]|uniref:N-acetyltransferase domain-containing protein n=1 Tax=Ceutorhynchus assimilis TaxID=467358 RepID=A0A9N9QPB4_9CUCU|nr:unnamed protein product [Ceutorhynchus assimilis]